MALLTARQLQAIRKIAELGMTTEFQIFRPSVEIGLESSSNPYGSSIDVTEEVTPVGGARGWLYSTPTPMASIDGGQLITVNTYRLWVPVETDIRPRDRVIIGQNTYIVTDTTADSTWAALLACTLRLAE